MARVPDQVFKMNIFKTRAPSTVTMVSFLLTSSLLICTATAKRFDINSNLGSIEDFDIPELIEVNKVDAVEPPVPAISKLKPHKPKPEFGLPSFPQNMGLSSSWTLGTSLGSSFVPEFSAQRPPNNSPYYSQPATAPAASETTLFLTPGQAGISHGHGPPPRPPPIISSNIIADNTYQPTVWTNQPQSPPVVLSQPSQPQQQSPPVFQSQQLQPQQQAPPVFQSQQIQTQPQSPTIFLEEEPIPVQSSQPPSSWSSQSPSASSSPPSSSWSVQTPTAVAQSPPPSSWSQSPPQPAASQSPQWLSQPQQAPVASQSPQWLSQPQPAPVASQTPQWSSPQAQSPYQQPQWSSQPPPQQPPSWSSQQYSTPSQPSKPFSLYQQLNLHLLEPDTWDKLQDQKVQWEQVQAPPSRPVYQQQPQPDQGNKYPVMPPSPPPAPPAYAPELFVLSQLQLPQSNEVLVAVNNNSTSSNPPFEITSNNIGTGSQNEILDPIENIADYVHPGQPVLPQGSTSDITIDDDKFFDNDDEFEVIDGETSEDEIMTMVE